jgi:hypothetical protein
MLCKHNFSPFTDKFFVYDANVITYTTASMNVIYNDYIL